MDAGGDPAGIARKQDFLGTTDEDFDAVLGVNLRGAFFGVQEAARQTIAQNTGMRADGRRGGVIVNMSSINALLANPSVATYAIAKGGMNQLTTTADDASYIIGQTIYPDGRRLILNYPVPVAE